MGTAVFGMVLFLALLSAIIVAVKAQEQTREKNIKVMFTSFDECSLEEVKEACERAGIGFDSDANFRRLFTLIGPQLIGSTYGSLLKAHGVPGREYRQLPNNERYMIEIGEINNHLCFLAKNLAEIEKLDGEDFLIGLKKRHGEYISDLTTALEIIRECKEKDKVKKDREEIFDAGIKALGGRKSTKKKADTF